MAKLFLAAQEHAAQIEKKVKSSSGPGRNTRTKSKNFFSRI